MKKITAVVHTRNSQASLERTLKTLAFVDEILVADMHSSDMTLQIAKKYTDRIVTVKDVGFADPVRNQVIDLVRHPWVLVVDSDETVPETLAIYLKHKTDGYDVWKVPRKNIILGKWIRHSGWWPDYQYHFFKKGHVAWEKTVHTHPKVKGLVGTIPAQDRYAKVHYNYDELESYFQRSLKYSRLQAEQFPQRYEGGPLAVFANELASRYIEQEGYKDGTHGLNLSLMQAMHEAMAGLRVWEKNGYPDQGVDPKKQLGKMVEIIRYWMATYEINRVGNVWLRWWWRMRRRLGL